MEYAIIVAMIVAVPSGAVVGAILGYRFGWHRALRRARGIIVTIGMHPQELGSMPPVKAWGLLTDRLLHALDAERERR